MSVNFVGSPMSEIQLKHVATCHGWVGHGTVTKPWRCRHLGQNHTFQEKQNGIQIFLSLIDSVL